MSRPNIIFILCDQMRGDGFGADGNPCVQTPNIDFLAARGTRFPHAYSACPSCLPARATLWTGMSQWHTGILGMGRGQGQIPNNYPHMLPVELAQGGYHTHLVGKGHFHPQRTMMGFKTHELDESGRVETADFKDEYRAFFDKQAPAGLTPDDHGIDWNAWQARPWHAPEHLHPTAWTMTRAMDFIANRPADAPFFLNISFARPHSPYVPPRDYFDMYIHGQTPPPHLGEWSAMHDRPEELPNPNAWRGRLTPQQIHRARCGYYGEISFIDAQVGRLINWMTRFQREAFANTWFIFSSDHGDMQGDHNLWRKTYAYEGSARIPFIIKPPPALAAQVRRIAAQPVELRDIMPTILDIAGLPCPATVDGQSVLKTLTDPDAPWRQYVHGEHCWCYSHEQEMQFVTDGIHKFVWLPRLGIEQFFDLQSDPGECFDLINHPMWQEWTDLWRSRLVTELAARDCGWVKDGKLHCPDNEPMVSPYKETFWLGD